ncbi:MAG: GNAT family N-acetyltransferase, partial [Chlamydiia bacterium]|nr:GNAT family N-acetyltransferase [Chlamydiia bacterium]
TLLFNRAVETVRLKGWKKLEWISDPNAEIFYLKMGATIIGHCENLLNPGSDLPLFEYYL